MKSTWSSRRLGAAFGGVLALVLSAPLLAQDGKDKKEVVSYTVEEIKGFLNVFKTTYKDKKAPQEDAISVLGELRQAYRFMASQEETSDFKSLKKQILSLIAKGLKVRKREDVTAECARTLGRIGEKSSAKALLNWMEKNVLKAKTINPAHVDVGFEALAQIGPTDPRSLELLLKNVQGLHKEPGVTNTALRIAPEWRGFNGKFRKDLYKRIMFYLGGLHSKSKQSGGESRQYKERYERVKDAGLRALSQLSGEQKPFKSIEKASAWWGDNKKSPWADYVGIAYRKKETTKES